MHLRQHFFLYALLLLIILGACGSYYRFMVVHQYTVEYEADCDPATHSCFTGCDDDACTSTYYYARMQKRESDIYNECGPDITDCDDAQSCLSGDANCSLTYCDASAGDECIGPDASLSESEDEQE